MTRRAVLGSPASGTMGLRVSLPGIDAVTGDSTSPNSFSFDSNWTDIAKVHQIGIVSVPPATNGAVVPFTDLGYRPFVEIRRVAGNLIYDDWFYGLGLVQGSAGLSGIGAVIDTSKITVPSMPGGSTTYAALYMVFRIPVPTQ